MRKIVEHQRRLVAAPIHHEHALELSEIGKLIDSVNGVVEAIHADLVAGLKRPQTGRIGMSADLVLRAIVVKQLNGFSYQALAFHLADSSTYRSFCNIGLGDRVPSPKTLQRNIKKVSAETLQKVHRLLLARAQRDGIEDGSKIRGDCTVTASNIHAPTDSSLLKDTVRVLARLLKEARKLVAVDFVDHTSRAKRRAIGIQYAARKLKRLPLYKDLLKLTVSCRHAGAHAAAALDAFESVDRRVARRAQALAAKLRHYVELADRVVGQTRRRILLGETVPAAEKIVSIFEPHTDIIRKGNRDTHYGHKLYLASGPSGLFTDARVLDGNPQDSTLAVESVKRHQRVFGQMPQQVAFDGGFASRANLEELKRLGIDDVAFAKRCGLKVSEMVRSSWVYRRLRNFRAGIEGGISFLKRVFGLDRCPWRGHASFKSYVWAGVVSANLLVMARHALE